MLFVKARVELASGLLAPQTPKTGKVCGCLDFFFVLSLVGNGDERSSFL